MAPRRVIKRKSVLICTSGNRRCLTARQIRNRQHERASTVTLGSQLQDIREEILQIQRNHGSTEDDSKNLMDMATTVTHEVKPLASSPSDSVDSDVQDADTPASISLPHSSLDNSVSVKILGEWSNWITAVEVGDCPVEQPILFLSKVTDTLAKMKLGGIEEAKSLQELGLAATSEVPAGSQALTTGPPRSHPSTSRVRNASAPVVNNGLLEFCSIDLNGRRFSLIVSKAEQIALLESAKPIKVVLQVLLKIFSPGELKRLTITGLGSNGEPCRRLPVWVISLCAKTLKTVLTSIPAGCSDLDKLDREIHDYITKICQYSRDTMGW